MKCLLFDSVYHNILDRLFYVGLTLLTLEVHVMTESSILNRNRNREERTEKERERESNQSLLFR